MYDCFLIALVLNYFFLVAVEQWHNIKYTGYIV